MKKNLLSTDVSDALLSLTPIPVDAVEVGTWFTVEQIRAYRERLPGTPFHFHAADWIENVGMTLDWANPFRDYLSSAQSSWISVHISVWEAGQMARLKRGERVPLPDPEQSSRALIRKVCQLQDAVRLPVLIENVEPLPLDGYDFWAQPDFIRGVVEQTGCDFLLDTGHARISAERLGMEVERYIQRLPLEKLVQIHVSGPRQVGGRLEDVHETLQEVDYDLFAGLLSRFQPQVVTLEYIRESPALREQLMRLQGMIEKWQ
jgi:uncharacterized protein (UPF0276 family)